ncbi:Glycoside hydrolase [Mycena chlorophos]|uniref:Glycoside hydrolase n=1 Tax=Mycena chlorophos TaxID=658473 RepID=A0A8H6RY69_MYCCL|nr:Glycoside hydrolase [Mycena chlorophos]
MSDAHSIALWYGPLIVGGCLAFMLSGVVAVQCIIFFKLYPDESKVKTTLVAGIWTIDVAQTAFIIAAFIEYFVVQFGNFNFVATIPWSIALTILATALQTCVVHLYYAAKIYRSSEGNWFITSPIVLFALLRVGATLGATGEMFRLGHWEAFLSGTPHFLFTAGLALSAATDAIITLCLCYYLRQIRKMSTSSVMDGVLNKLTLYTLENGFITFLTTLAILCFWLLLRHTSLALALHFVIGKLYPNSLLMLLNTRKSLRDMHGDAGAMLLHTDDPSHHHHLAAYYALFPHRVPNTHPQGPHLAATGSPYAYSFHPSHKAHDQAPVQVQVQRTVVKTTQDPRRRRDSDGLSMYTDDLEEAQTFERPPPSFKKPDARFVFPASYPSAPASETGVSLGNTSLHLRALP